MFKAFTAATLALTVAVVAPATAAGASAGTSVGASAGAKSKLTLSYESDSGFAASVVLRCKPARGPHPFRKEACRAIDRADGDFDDLDPEHDTVCAPAEDEITATAVGRWEGDKVDWEETYDNLCEMVRDTGVVFVF